MSLQYFGYSFRFRVKVESRPDVGILVTLVCPVTCAFACLTCDSFDLQLLLVFFVGAFFCDVFLVLAARTVDLCFAAAPPHSAAPLRSMGAARPIEILIVVVLFVTINADLLRYVNRSSFP